MRTCFFSLLTLLLLLLWTNPSDAQQCPRKIKNCRGLCGWFIDQNRDGYCDLTENIREIMYNSQRVSDSLEKLAAEKEARRLDSLAKLSEVNTSREKNTHQTDTLRPTTAQQSPEGPKSGKTPPEVIKTTPEGSVKMDEELSIPQGISSAKTYDFFLIMGSCLILYLLTFTLSRTDLLKKSTHRKIWNVLLLLTFLATGLLGLFMVIQLNYNLFFDWFSPLLYWHVEFGIAMAAISIFHLLWHLRYWLHLFTQAGKKQTEK